jgi:hypothetical protein
MAGRAPESSGSAQLGGKLLPRTAQERRGPGGAVGCNDRIQYFSTNEASPPVEIQGTCVIPQIFEYILDHDAFATGALHDNALLYKSYGKIGYENTGRERWIYRYEKTQQPSCHEPHHASVWNQCRITPQITTYHDRQSKCMEQLREIQEQIRCFQKETRCYEGETAGA